MNIERFSINTKKTCIGTVSLLLALLATSTTESEIDPKRNILKA